MGVNVRHKLERRATGQGASVRLAKNMITVDMVEALELEMRRAFPAVLVPERFTGMVLSSIDNTSELAERTLMSFIVALLSTAQSGLESNTSLGQAYLTSYKNKDKLKCQFQLGYKGLTDLVY